MEKEWLKKIGSMQQEAYIRKIEYAEGRAGGLKAYQVKSGPLMFTSAQDKCLDITELSWRGINFNFISKPGLQNGQAYDYNGFAGQRSIMGGMFFTVVRITWERPESSLIICFPCTEVCALRRRSMFVPIATGRMENIRSDCREK